MSDDPICDLNSGKCNFSNGTENEDTTLFSSENLSRSPLKMPTLTTSNAEPLIGSTIIPPRPDIPPRNYGNSASLSATANPLYNQYSNRYPYASQRFGYGGGGGYSMYGYGSGYPYYPGGVYGGFNTYNGLTNSESRFIRAAEENIRPTFQAIESITRAINSIAFMMESTFGSLNMSFQAVLSVIENFSHARTFLKQFFTSVLTLRIFHKFVLMIIHLLRKMNLITEESASRLLWQGAQSDQLSSGASAVVVGGGGGGISMWPIFTFLGLMLGAPYFISKMLPPENDQGKEWNPTVDRHIPLVGVHDFQAGNTSEISFQRGERLKMVPPEVSQSPSPYWVFVANEKNQTGFVPRNHVTPA